MIVLMDTNVSFVCSNCDVFTIGFVSARPEEVIWKISTKELNSAHGVPQDVVSAVARIFPNLTKSTEATAYPEGSPTHPSWPAMHSAISSASMWMAVVMDLTEEQFCQAKLMDWGVCKLLFCFYALSGHNVLILVGCFLLCNLTLSCFVHCLQPMPALLLEFTTQLIMLLV
jgi:hypothetical protein